MCCTDQKSGFLFARLNVSHREGLPAPAKISVTRGVHQSEAIVIDVTDTFSALFVLYPDNPVHCARVIATR